MAPNTMTTKTTPATPSIPAPPPAPATPAIRLCDHAGLDRAMRDYRTGQITLQEAARQAGVSRGVILGTSTH